MNTKGLILTERGKDLFNRAQAGTAIKFSHVEYGSGVLGDEVNPELITGLLEPKVTLPIQEITTPGDGSVVITVAFTNTGIAEGFYHRETAIYADDPIHGNIAYAFHYSTDGGFVAAGGGAYIIEDVTDYIIEIGNATTVQAVINNMVVLATKVDITDHNADPEAHDELFKRLATGIPAIISPADGATNIGETPMFLFSEFVPTLAGTSEQAIQFQTDIIGGDFTTPIHDTGWLTTIAKGYELPHNIYDPKNSYKSRVRRRLNNGLISGWSEIPTLTTRDIFNYVLRAVNLEPVSGATNVGECPTFKCSPFAVAGDVVDTHVATEFRIRQGDTVIHLSPELGAVLEYKLPAGLHLVSNDYVYEFRHKGSLLGWGEWSVATPYRTAAAFITGDEAVYPSSWVGYDEASAAGVALADDAALRSNGIDQDEGEGNWAEYSVRAKARANGLTIDPTSTDQQLVVLESVEQGNDLATNLGRVVAGVVTKMEGNIIGIIPSMTAETTSGCTVSSQDIYGTAWKACDGLGGVWYGIGDYPRILQIKFGKNAFKISSYSIECAGLSSTYLRNFTLQVFNGSAWEIVDSRIDQIFQDRIPRTFNLSDVASGSLFRLVVTANYGHSQIQVSQFQLTGREVKYAIDISSGNFPSAPTRAHIIPKLTAATGPAGTVFTPDNFKEIAVESATLGTDSGPDRPDFILLESAKQTPAESFRRVALGVSGLSEDSECRVAETQIDTWKQGV